MLDFSQRRELGLYATIVADIEAAASPLGITPLIVGALARDLHLMYAFGIETLRQTEDIDFALAVRSWAEWEELHGRLTRSGMFTASTAAAHRLRHRSNLPIDLVPFGGVESTDRRIAWPPRGEVVMDVLGFREALASAVEVVLPGEVRTRAVSLSALALLKIVCWQDRHYEAPRKDAHDLMLILRNYLQAGNEARLWNDFVDWTQEEAFDYECAGARMLGLDIGVLLDEDLTERIGGLLREQTSVETPARLPAQMSPADPERARELLDAMARGLVGAAPHPPRAR